MSENFSASDVGYHINEDFATNDAITDGLVGNRSWEIAAISGGADTLTYETAQGETFLRMTGGGAGDGDGTALSLAADKYSFSQYGGEIRFGVRIPNITGNTIASNNFRIGFADVVTSGEPVVGLWADCNGGVMEFDCASANGDVNAAVSASKLTSSTTLVIGTTYDMVIKWSGNNGNTDPGPASAQLLIDGQLGAEFNGNVLLDGAETLEPVIIHWADTGGASTLELDVFYYEAFSFRAK